ncbi:uncharacterized protein LOC135682792 [Rhopilema esculentum]|uniref:uncharacterized protein LOC135682792 n=1 Tax=Rhopilema esculentum TaxID=499914 RepID=UPI0031D51E9B
MEPHQHGLIKQRIDSEDLSDIYSASERKKGSRAPWTSQDMISAMLLVKQGMSITKAAQSLNIPRTTLRDRVTGKVRSAKRAVTTSALSAQDERALIDYYKIMRKQGYGKAKDMIMYMAGKTVKKNGNVSGEPFPSTKWWQSFCARHNQPLANESEEFYGMQKQRVRDMLLSNCTQQLFDGLTSNKYGINFLEHSELIFSCNESSFDLNDMAKRFNQYKSEMGKTGQEACEEMNTDAGDHAVSRVDGKISVSLDNDTRMSKPREVSVITCVNALGQSLPPLFIHMSDNRDTPRGNFEKYAQDRLDDDFFLVWFHDIFLQNLARRGPCILIYDGQNCLVTREMLMAASVNDVIMFCIPAVLSQELQPMDLSLDGVFSETWKNVAVNHEPHNTFITNQAFTEIFKEFWGNVSSEVVVTDRFKSVGIFPFSRQNITTANLNTVFEGDDFGPERLNPILGPDPDLNLQGRRKDSLVNIAMKNPRSNLGNFDKHVDGNQNFVRPSGRITRPTMSILNQPLNDPPIITQMMNDEDEFREDFPEISNSTDEFSSCSDEGSSSMVALSSSVTSLPNSGPQKGSCDSLPGVSMEHVISPTMAPQKRLHMPKVTEVNLYDRHLLSPPASVRNPMAQFQRVIHTGPGTLSRKRPSPYAESRPSAPKAYPLSGVSLRYSSPDIRSDAFIRGQSNIAELRALEEVLDPVRKAKFQKAFDDGLDVTEDFDPLFQLWKSVKLRFIQNPGRVEHNPHACQINQVSPSIIEIAPKTTGSATSADTRLTSHQTNSSCQCSENFRTILTPAGNLSVNRNATVIVIMPEKQGAQEETATGESANGRDQGSCSTSV